MLNTATVEVFTNTRGLYTDDYKGFHVYESLQRKRISAQYSHFEILRRCYKHGTHNKITNNDSYTQIVGSQHKETMYLKVGNLPTQC